MFFSDLNNTSKKVDNFLVINTSSSLQIGIFKKNHLEFYLNGLLEGEITSDVIVPKIIDALQGLKIDFSDISFIASITGPGYFTGLRTSATIANMLHILQGIPLVGVSLPQVLAQQVFNQDQIDLVLICNNIGKAGAVISLLDYKLENQIEPVYIDSVEQFIVPLITRYAAKKIAIVGDKQDILLKSNLKHENLYYYYNIMTADIHVFGSLGMSFFLQNKLLKKIHPLYIKEPDAIALKKIT